MLLRQDYLSDSYITSILRIYFVCSFVPEIISSYHSRSNGNNEFRSYLHYNSLTFICSSISDEISGNTYLSSCLDPSNLRNSELNRHPSIKVVTISSPFLVYLPIFLLGTANSKLTRLSLCAVVFSI